MGIERRRARFTPQRTEHGAVSFWSPIGKPGGSAPRIVNGSTVMRDWYAAFDKETGERIGCVYRTVHGTWMVVYADSPTTLTANSVDSGNPSVREAMACFKKWHYSQRLEAATKKLTPRDEGGWVA